MNFEDQVSQVLKASSNNMKSDHERIKHNIKNKIGKRNGDYRVPFSKFSSAAAVLIGSVIFVSGISFASGVNPFSVVVSFVHNIGQEKSFGSGYYFQDGGPYQDTADAKKLVLSGYGINLDQFIGTSDYLKLDADHFQVNDVVAYMVNREKQYFYVLAKGSTNGGHSIGLDIYHNTNKSLYFEGQTTSDHKKDIDLSGIKATYIEFANANTGGTTNYLTWKNGEWTVALHSIDSTEKVLAEAAQAILQIK
ncbi:hypothetical protein P4H65_12170 [Paenibacillus chitinolyticus]|nr:hypothetical protein [Paenibacillus chitinolyticus]MEC0246544.1 hypothetical protein [Paenibacillus chitinolyticus]